MHEAHKKIPTFKPSQQLIEELVNKAETKVQLRRSVKVYVKDILEDPLVRQEPRQRLMDAIFRRFLQMGDHRVVRALTYTITLSMSFIFPPASISFFFLCFRR